MTRVRLAWPCWGGGGGAEFGELLGGSRPLEGRAVGWGESPHCWLAGWDVTMLDLGTGQPVLLWPLTKHVL